MTTQLSEVSSQSPKCTTSPSPYYKTRVAQALELLREAAEDDLEYVDDMLIEGIREGIMTAALVIVNKLNEFAIGGNSARIFLNGALRTEANVWK
jgi:aconitase B